MVMTTGRPRNTSTKTRLIASRPTVRMRSRTESGAARPVNRRWRSAFSWTRAMPSRVPKTRDPITARDAAIRVALKPSQIRSHSSVKFSLPGSISGPHFSIVNSPRASSGR
jgi:hypothetical protein